MLIGERIELLRKAHPKQVTRGAAAGMLFASTRPTGPLARIKVYTLLVSTDNTHMVHECVIDRSEKPKTPEQWGVWLRENFSRVYTDGVLPGIAIRTGKQWGVQKIIGFANAKPVARNSKHVARRRKAKPKARAHG